MVQFKALLLDIEGTITSISFVKDKLFPYAFENVGNYLEAHFEEAKSQEIMKGMKNLAETERETDVNVRPITESHPKCIEDVVHNVRHWISIDKKLTVMKELQGLIWEEAYKKGDVMGHLYPDVVPVLKQLSLPIYIYSSGSVHAQKLLFRHSVEGDVTPLLSGNFDTNVGLKGDSSSYSEICRQIQQKPDDVLFLSDIEKECDAAKSAGLQCSLVVREGNSPLSEDAKKKYKVIHSLEEIS